MKGTLLNTATVAAGAGLGWAVGRYIPGASKDVALDGLGIVVALLGARMFLQSKNAVVVVVAVALGGIVGLALGIAHGLEVFAEWIRQAVGGTGHFNEAMVTTSVLYCVGPMTILGCLQDGLDGNTELLTIKSTLDGISSIFFAATLGLGVLASAGVVLVVQGALTLSARGLQRFAKNETYMAEVTAVGGVLMVGMALNLLSIKRLHMETYLPALVLAPFLSQAATWVTNKEKSSFGKRPA